MRDPFDIRNTPLQPGITLLEASAGSGKTWTIEAIFLRLVLEEHIDVSEILVCTYTKAATRELQERIRARLRKAAVALAAGYCDEEAAANARALHGDADVLARLRHALDRFDDAQIFTIHSFCGRALDEHAFESGSTFDAELLTDAGPLDERVIRDFVRRSLPNHPILAATLACDGSLRASIGALLGKRGADRDFQLYPGAASTQGLAALEASLSAAFSDILNIWRVDSADILAQISDRRQVKEPIYGSADTHAASLTDACGCRLPHASVLNAIRALRASKVKANVKKKAKDVVVDHRFYDACETFCKRADAARLALVRHFFDAADAGIDALREQQNVLTFDDLLHRAAAAVRDADSPLARALSERYKAALIDEFQDTDPLQWGIFNRLFGGGMHHFYLIGDPKQAIYRFRGADVHAYLDAARSANRILTLGINWRSEAPLVAGVNSVFSCTQGVFRTQGIDFEDAQPNPNPDPEKVLHATDAPDAAPLRFVIDGGSSPMGNADQRQDWLLGQLGDDIAALLASDSRIGTRPVRPRDIAVLVRTGRQGLAAQAVLHQRGIPAVLDSDASVFDSPQAASLLLLMQALNQVGDGAVVRAALLSPLIALPTNELARLREDDTAWQHWVDRLSACHGAWIREGFIVAFNRLAGECNIRQRLMSGPEGERALTNLLHLVELLHAAERTRKLSPAALASWLGDMIRSPRQRPQEGHQLRLETDAEAVQILTVHKSKGLEFPLVYCPFLTYDSTPRAYEYVVLRTEGGARALWLKPFSELEEETQNAAAEEELAGGIRLLYVALTRARNRCTVYLVPDEMKAGKSGSLAICQCLGIDSGDQLHQCLEAMQEATGEGCISVDVRADAVGRIYTPENEAAAALTCRKLQAQVDTRGLLASFSSLHGDIETVELPDREDAPAQRSDAELPTEGIAAFPRGTGAGNFFHACFEELAYDAPQTFDAVVEAKLIAHGLDADQWKDSALHAIRQALSTPLWPSGPRLDALPSRDLLRETEFYFPVQRLDVKWIADAFAQHGGPLAPLAPLVRKLAAHDISGYMKGYIDLIFRHEGQFHILDWKSNWLGSTPAAYHPAALDAAMRQHRYFLQHCIYAVALDRHLRLRLPGYSYEQHFGGACYVFLRGLDPARPGWAVSRARPPQALIEALSETFQLEEVPA